MGEVLVVFKVYPNEPEDLEKIKEKIPQVLPSKAQLVEIREEPIGFGFSALLVGVKMPDEGGIQAEVEEAIASIEEVDSVEVERATLI
ncbi:MAG: elongation factor 1-beta [Candidatus Diapherotrites archaeon]|nr:elongation factor 1-beta [Candidatus Diapherotrites archaeon]